MDKGGLIALLNTRNAVITLSEDDYMFLEKASGNNSAEGYINELIQKEITALRLKNGYAEMAQINLELAEESLDADEQCARWYEKRLSE